MFKKGLSTLFLLSLFVTSCSSIDNTTGGEKYCSLIINNVSGGTVNVVENVDLNKIKVGTTLNFSVETETGYTLDSLLVDNTNITSSLKFLFLEAKEYNVYPTYIKNGDVVDEEKTGYVTSETASNGSFTVSKSEGKVGETIVVTTSPNSGYETENVTVNGADIAKVETNKYQFSLKEGENKVKVTFKYIETSGSEEIDLTDLYKASKIKPSRGSQGTIDQYYEPCRGKKGKELKDALHNIIKGHKQFSYKSATSAMKNMDADPFNKNNMYYIYEGSLPNSTSYNKEHTWAKSHGGFDGVLPMHSDYHNLRPSDSGINSRRGNYDFGTVSVHNSTTSTSKRASQDGNYIGTGKNTTSKVFEPKDEFKGDVARIIFYMATRYEGDNGEYDLEVNGKIPSNYNNFTSGAKGLHGNFIDLYEWLKVDPVSDYEVNRNNVIDIDYQHNRNPFIDHPEFIIMIYDKNYSGPGALN